MIRTGAFRSGFKDSALAGWSRLGTMSGRLKSEAYEQARNRPVLMLGEGLFIFLTLALSLPLTIRNTREFTALYVLICVSFSLIAIFVTRSFVRPVFPIVILLGIQVWMLVCYFLVSPYIVPEAFFGRHQYWPTLIALPYFVLGSICILDPTWRQKALKILFYFCMLNALVGLAQFVRLPGFAAIQQYYAPAALGQDFFGNTPNEFRAVGLTLHPYHLAAQCVFGMAIIGSNLLERRLYPREIVSMMIFMAALFVAQSRAYYASGAIIVIVLLVLLFRRDKVLFTWSVSAMAVGALLILTLFSNRLSYGLRGQNTVEFGRLDRWASAANLVKEFPLTGIGPSADLFGNDPHQNQLPSRRNLLYTENGYRMLAGTGGIPGLALLLTGLIGTFLVSVRVATKHFRDSLQRRMAFVGALYIVSIAIALGITNMFEHEILTFLGISAAAISLPDVGKAFQSGRIKRKLGYGFANSAQE